VLEQISQIDLENLSFQNDCFKNSKLILSISDMELQKNGILKKAGQLFNQYGFKSVTMDDISRELGISKKTLYLHFTSKRNLINSLLEESKKQLTSQIEGVKNQEFGGLEKLYNIYLQIVKFSNESNTVTYWSFKKYYCELYNDFVDFIGVLIDDTCEKLIKESQWDGFILSNINAKVFSCFLRTSFLEIPNNNLTQNMNVDREILQKDFVYYNLRSVATSTGLNQLDKIKEK